MLYRGVSETAALLHYNIPLLFSHLIVKVGSIRVIGNWVEESRSIPPKDLYHRLGSAADPRYATPFDSVEERGR
jgi:hypothetical protein